MKKSIIFKLLALALAMVTGVCMFTACGQSDNNAEETEATTDVTVELTEAETTAPEVETETTAPEAETEKPDANAEHTKVKFEITIAGSEAGSFTMELYPEHAPITVANFISLVEKGFYNGLTFHRIAEGYYGPFVAQGGDPKGNGTGGSTPIKGEFAVNGVNNTLSHTRGVVSMARRPDSFDSGSCQFFICYNGNYTSALDGQYAAFGKVIEGMEVVDSFLDVERDYNDRPVDDIVIKAAYIVK